MKNNTSCQQFPSDDSPREELDKLLLRVEHHVRDVMHKDGRLRPTLFAVSPEGLSIFAPGPLNEVSEKNEFAAVARLICAAQGAIAVVLAIEAWVLEAKPGERLDPYALPSASPHRREFISLSGEALGRTYQQKFLTILRDHRGRIACLGMAKVLPPEPAEGRFSNLLPQIPVTEEVRVFAAAVLKTKGIFRVKSLGEY